MGENSQNQPFRVRQEGAAAFAAAGEATNTDEKGSRARSEQQRAMVVGAMNHDPECI